jgi:plastocyanin
MRSFIVNLAGFAVVLMPAFGHAAEYIISQEGKKFAPETVDAKVGDTLRFQNDDRVGHTVYSETPGFDFTIGKQKPGESDVVALDKAGEFEVRCAIHPRMKLTVVVSE